MAERKLTPGSVAGVTREVRSSPGHAGPVAVDGVLADVLRKELSRGGADAAVRSGGPEGAAVYVRVVGERVTDEDELALGRARRARVPVVVVSGTDERIPHVLATDVVRLRPGAGFPVEEIAAVVARRLGEQATALAARLPVLRRPVSEYLVRRFARKNAIIGAAVFVPGVDMPVLTLNQLRLVLRIAAAHGEQVGSELVPELLGTVAAGFGFRALARQVLELVPVAGWAVKGAVAYTGTRAVGEAAIARFGAEAVRRDVPMRRRPGAASRAAS